MTDLLKIRPTITCHLGSQSVSQTQNHQGNNCSRWLPEFVILVIITMLALTSTKKAHAHTHKEIIIIVSSMLNVLGNACRGV